MKRVMRLWIIVAASVFRSTAVFSNAKHEGTRQFPIGDFRNCKMADGVVRAEVLPGNGWDNLRNVDMGMVVQANYSKCRLTDDGKYMIPDNCYAFPIKRSSVETFGEIIDHWSNYKDTTSSSINAGISVFSMVSGSFSDEHRTVKMQQVNDKSVTTRVQLRHLMYKVILEPDSSLNPTFKARLLDIATLIESNNTALARYHLELLVRDYGTHLVTSVDAGATLAQIEQVKSTFMSQYWERASDIRASMSANFFGKIGISFSAGRSQDERLTKGYMDNLTNSRILTFGGPPYRANFTVNQWEEGLADTLVAIDRSGDPLYYIVTHNNVPEIPEPTLLQIVDGLKRAIELYFKFNTITGCTSQDSPNFNFQANLDDGSCKAPDTNFTFGGVYQTCDLFPETQPSDICDSLTQKNPLTGDFTCPPDYDHVLLNQGTVSKQIQEQHCKRHCAFIIWFCKTTCWVYYTMSRAAYHAYWCAARGSVGQHSGYLFGGLYTKTDDNPLTKTQGCPLHFYPLHLGSTMQICVSDDYELGYAYSLPFSGFFSCKSGNPLVHNSHVQHGDSENRKSTLESYIQKMGPSSWPHRCPNGYSQHLAAVDENCEINYCVKVNALTKGSLPNIRRPPFRQLPGMTSNQTDMRVIVDPASNVWIKNTDTQKWEKSNLEALKTLPVNMMKVQTIAERNLNGGQVAGITVGITALIGIVVGVAVVGWRRSAKKKFLYRRADRNDTSESTGPYGTFHDDTEAPGTSGTPSLTVNFHQEA